MKKLHLMLHCGGHAATLEEIKAVETPQATDSYCPLPHIDYIDSIRAALDNMGLEVLEESHALARNGGHYFGLFQVDGLKNTKEGKTTGTVVGARNSHTKQFPAGLMAGSSPFVCDNLAFHNEVNVFRRHSKFMMRDLPQMIHKGIGMLLNTWQNHSQRMEVYHQTPITDAEAHDLIIRAFMAGAIGPQSIPAVLNQWYQPEHEEFAADQSLYRLHNAFTNISRGNVLKLPAKSFALQPILDGVAKFETSRELVALEA
jgi:hypothetical protein